MIHTMPLSCIVFDCDGVILESVNAKTEAFARICNEIAPEHTEVFIDYVSLHGGVSRFEKFAWLIERAERRAITGEESRVMGDTFRRYCLEAVLSAPLVPGFRETADRWLGRVPMYVASGAPHHELVDILARRGLSRYFAGILGTPPAKTSLLLSCVLDAQAKPEHTVMVGDSKTDLDAALVAGTMFYGRGPYFAGKACPGGPDLTGLNAFLEEAAASAP